MIDASVSHGGGVQTTAMLVLAAEGRIPHRRFLFANVGDNAENPLTLAYHRTISVPFAEAHGIELRELRWVTRKGETRDLYDDLIRQESSITIPLRDSGGFMPRKCTAVYKIQVVAREVRRLGATVAEPGEVAIGISVDEIERAKPGVPKQQPWTCKTYPLLDLGLRQSDCRKIITNAGLPMPPKSACSFCPFMSPEHWRQQRRRDPELFARNVELDAIMRERHIKLRHGGPGGIASPTLPLDVAVDDQGVLFEDADCDSGYCFT